MKQAFIIMQIGEPSLDKICKDIIVPALEANNLTPKRVDKHNEGGLLKSEITHFIESSDIIVADLTNERPNCYLEVGYAMGREKYSKLILTCREDHNPDSVNYKIDGPKVHFDLAGYDILWWNPTELEKFRTELDKRIKRRLKAISSSQVILPFDNPWFQKNQTDANLGFARQAPYMEVRMGINGSKLNVAQRNLLIAAQKAEIRNTGWPIGLVSYDETFKPRPMKDCIVAKIDSPPNYDFWALKNDGSFYLFRNLWKDDSSEKNVFYDVIIWQVTELLFYSLRLYAELGGLPSDTIIISIKHGGLKNYNLISSENYFFKAINAAQEDEITTEVETLMGHIEPNLVELVEKFTNPLFMLFDFFELPRPSLEKNINDFIRRIPK